MQSILTSFNILDNVRSVLLRVCKRPFRKTYRTYRMIVLRNVRTFHTSHLERPTVSLDSKTSFRNGNVRLTNRERLTYSKKVII